VRTLFDFFRSSKSLIRWESIAGRGGSLEKDIGNYTGLWGQASHQLLVGQQSIKQPFYCQ